MLPGECATASFVQKFKNRWQNETLRCQPTVKIFQFYLSLRHIHYWCKRKFTKKECIRNGKQQECCARG